jgi:hypothetical protein
MEQADMRRQADILFKNKGMETGYSVQKILEELSREEILR